MSKSSNKIVFSRRGIVLDLIFLAVAGFLVWAVKHWTPRTQNGFFCDDDTIRYPHSKETVDGDMLHNVCYILPAVLFVVVEFLHVFTSSSPQDTRLSVYSRLVYRLCELYGCFLFGYCLMEVTTDLGKYTVGRLRPHFLAVCKLKEDVCLTLEDPHTYVTDFECTHDTSEARVSFPSGHSSHGFYTAIFLMIYLHYRVRWTSLRAPKLILQGALLLAAYFTAVSRIHDFMHHPSDVAAGSFIGFVWGVITALLLTNLKTVSRYATDEDPFGVDLHDETIKRV